ncbi:ATP-binding protein [Gluconobacter sphaericus]|uniref:ATP-binding protein n=1 Tax=Gluconobacter sphaericus NBRC 12467 TaxID=1307951 RepID=A0AA37SGH8_9PROT|nr:ATP-binding protein [Gluconobacter sphaericus]MBF0884578.1 ATP-binding protein [Gluconobacter sphaericus]GBR53531.1 GMP reductase [Gluconobacter sphaericus NBRC 12467]GEB41407.1 ATP-binding protein [Gluconobacter sphaericus NBRC 12467]GLQ83517.1 ATP-binding protein [Gluconobacter sphaericus NBRC 12467]
MTSIVLGQGRDGSDTCIDLPELLATRLLVQGNSGSGKSHLLRRLLEQTSTLVQQVMIDPEGDFVTLADHYGHLVIDVEDQSEASLRAAGERVRAHRASVVLNLEQVEAEMQLRAAGAFLNGMFEAPRSHWYPALVVVDEAQLFAPVTGGDTSDEARRLSLGAMTNLMCRGRKRGLAGVIATQRLAKLAKNVAAEASNFLMGRTFLDIDMARAADLLGMERRAAESFRDLARGQFMALGPALSRRPKLVAIGPVTTASHATGPVLVPLEPVSAEDLRDIILEPVHEFTPRPRRESRPPPPDLLAQLDAYGAEREAEEPAPAAVAVEANPDQLWSLVAEVVAGEGSDYKPLATLYQDFQLRARIQGLSRNVLELGSFNRMLATIRAGMDRERSESEDWKQAQAIAATLPEDVQGVFLLLARTALDGETCPGDEALARAYGTHSLGRARRQLNYLEEREVIVLQDTPLGRRVAIVGLGWQTA